MRIDPDLKFERRLWKSGLTFVAGLDEAGRGALAGPVAVGAVILRREALIQRAYRRSSTAGKDGDGLRGIRDSKQMSPAQREAAAPRIKELAVAWGVGFAPADEIDAMGIVAAVRLAALRALLELGILPEYLLTDFRLELPELDVPQTSLVRGDVHCLSIAAASVLAKTTRDALMQELDGEIPGYDLGKHKGYGTHAHRMALQRIGQSPIHRRSFSVKT